MITTVDLRPRPGPLPWEATLEETLVLQLAEEYQRREDPSRSAVSWANQHRANAYFAAHGFEATLGHMLSLEAGVA